MKKSTAKAIRFGRVYGMGPKKLHRLIMGVFVGAGPKIVVKPPSWWAEPEAFARWRAQNKF
jgi:hypothetical protein